MTDKIKCSYCGSKMIGNMTSPICINPKCEFYQVSVPVEYVEDLNNCVQVLEKCYEIAKSVRGNGQLQTSDIKPTDLIIAEINKILKKD